MEEVTEGSELIRVRILRCPARAEHFALSHSLKKRRDFLLLSVRQIRGIALSFPCLLHRFHCPFRVFLSIALNASYVHRFMNTASYRVCV